ncbi:hypothetical protein CL633_04460 [bacterium]|jgi:predicted glutamine amidotransferase|nr:hypothetical protein [bacterium]|tara:strand:- start:5252 stop:6037 length:786 start_codon:yes stop_codon:yes gene_type:complete
MCRIISINQKTNQKLKQKPRNKIINQIIHWKHYNNDGLALLAYNNDSKDQDRVLLKFLKIKNKKIRKKLDKIIKTKDNIIIHLRANTAGATTAKNIHLWQHNGWFFGHNGFCAKKSNDLSESDSLDFFNNHKKYLFPNKLNHLKIVQKAKNYNLIGKTLHVNPDKKQIYLMGDFEMYAMNNALIASSHSLDDDYGSIDYDINGVNLLMSPTQTIKQLKKSFTANPYYGYRYYDQYYGFDDRSQLRNDTHYDRMGSIRRIGF